MVGFYAVPEQVLPAAEDHRVEEEPELVDQIVGEQRVDQIGAAVHQQVASGPLFEPSDLGDDVAAEDGGVGPVSG